MNQFVKISQWIIAIFSFLCLTQVRNWFEKIIESIVADCSSFVLNGKRFSILPNQSFIIDETLRLYGLNFNANYKLN